MSDALSHWYHGRRVLVTGHTGFKGAWLTAWLRSAGAVVTGYALAPERGRRSLYLEAGLDAGITSIIDDIRDLERLRAATRNAAPEIVFHLAAQSLVRRSYRDPVTTMATNVLGTAHLLEAVRETPGVCAVVVVTSDKCYENDGSGLPLAEDAPMGGHDPYSASKGCAELVAAAWRRSFLGAQGVAVATARAGNVFGGGDWAEDRLVPDLLGAAGRGEVATIRNPDAIRPWQYVLEPLHGYLLLGQALVTGGQAVAGGWNFGPALADALTVRDIAARLAATWDRVRVVEAADPDAPHEAATLTLDARKASQQLGWRPQFTLEDALDTTARWYRDASTGAEPVPELVARDLTAFQAHLSPATTAHSGTRSS